MSRFTFKSIWIGLVVLLISCTNVTAQRWGDYTVIGIQNQTTTQVYDTSNTLVKTFTHTGFRTGYSSHLMPGGYLWKTISRTGNSFTGGPICGQVIKLAWDGTLLWNFVYSTTEYCSHHDFIPLPNGNVMLICYERHSAADVLANGGTFNGELWSEKVVEIKPTGPTTGDVVWEWRLWDHLVQDKDSTKPNYKSSIVNNPQLMNINYKATKDWVHMNGIDYNPILDQIVVSSHNLNEWWVIDHSTSTAEAASHSGGNSGKGGDILFRWGNPAAYGASGTQILKVTHDAHWIDEGIPNEGRLVGFNNQGIATNKSAVDQIMPPYNGYNYDLTLGSAYAPATFDDRHACNGYTSNMGSSQQLPNGNMLVCMAIASTVYEVNASGSTLWSKTFTGGISQAFKYDKCYVNNQPPALPIITENNKVLSSTPGATYQWYKNGQKIVGATNINYTPADSGVYLVRITDSVCGNFYYSSGYKFKSSGGGTGVDDLKSLSPKIFPNPTKGTLNISMAPTDNYEIKLFDLQGRMLIKGNSSGQIDLSEFSNGIYLLVIQVKDGRTSITKISLNK